MNKEIIRKFEFNKHYKPKVAFICNHNSCRSQIAEALGKHYGYDIFVSYSAGTEIKSTINQDAVRLMKEIYSIDMEKTQYNKKLEEIPNPDIAIFMGCNVQCPYLQAKYSENWGLEDPSGESDDFFMKIIKEIDAKIKLLIDKIEFASEL